MPRPTPPPADASSDAMREHAQDVRRWERQQQRQLLDSPDGLVVTSREWKHWTRESHPIDGCHVCRHVRRCVHAAQRGERVECRREAA